MAAGRIYRTRASPYKKPLEAVGRDARFPQLVGGLGRRSESLDGVPVLLGTFTDNGKGGGFADGRNFSSGGVADGFLLGL